MVPIVLVCGAVAGVAYLLGGPIAAAIAGGTLLLPLGLALAGALGTYRSSVWTLSYLQPEPVA